MLKGSVRNFGTSSVRYSKLDTSKFIPKANFDRNFPKKPVKAWDKAGMDKESFFKTKYAHVHAKQLKERNVLKEYQEKQKYKDIKREEFREKKQFYKARKYEGEHYVQSFKNPLSEFVYGSSAVSAALQSNKRNSFARLILQGVNEKDEELIKLAKSKGISVTNLDKHHMNILCDYRPHNGVILETRPVSLNDIKKLGPVITSEELESTKFQVYEQDSITNMVILNESTVVRETEEQEEKCNPLGIFIDEVTDPQNMGAIIRSAYYLGADFLIVTSKNCSPMNSVVAKASSGALDLMKIYSTEKPFKLITDSQENGWKFISAAIGNKNSEKVVETEGLKLLLKENPCVLILGSEGEGIRKSIIDRSDHLVKLKSFRSDINKGKSVVDSLNVSVASALLMNKFFE